MLISRIKDLQWNVLLQINAYLQINQIKIKWLKRNFFNFEFFLLGESATSLNFCSDLLPLIHIVRDHRKRNNSVHLMIYIIFSYLLPVVLMIIWAICLWNIEHSLLTLPETENTNEVKMPCTVNVLATFFFLMST